MDETHISIVIRPIYIERLIYWIIIIVLAVLLALAWMKDGSDDATTDTTQKVEQQPTAPPTTQPTTPAAQPTTQTPPANAGTCTDLTKNQDETDIDCGGKTCGIKCGLGKACTVAADCTSSICANNTCVATAPVALSGKMTFQLMDVTTQKSPTSDNVKVTGIKYRIINGLSEDYDAFRIRVYLESTTGSCLLQDPDAEGDCDTPYADFKASGVDSAKNATISITLSEVTTPKYLYKEIGYDPSDSSKNKFRVVAYLTDSTYGKIGGKDITDEFLVIPQ
jgi:hypothetical protein